MTEVTGVLVQVREARGVEPEVQVAFSAKSLCVVAGTAIADLFTGGGSAANGYLTTEFSCLSSGCHTGETKVWAEATAGDIHREEFSPVGGLSEGPVS